MKKDLSTIPVRLINDRIENNINKKCYHLSILLMLQKYLSTGYTVYNKKKNCCEPFMKHIGGDVKCISYTPIRVGDSLKFVIEFSNGSQKMITVRKFKDWAAANRGWYPQYKVFCPYKRNSYIEISHYGNIFSLTNMNKEKITIFEKNW